MLTVNYPKHFVRGIPLIGIVPRRALSNASKGLLYLNRYNNYTDMVTKDTLKSNITLRQNNMRTVGAISSIVSQQPSLINIKNNLSLNFTRGFHQSHSNNFFNGRSPFGGPPKVRFISLTPGKILLFAVVFYTIFFMMLPILITLFIPITIGLLAVYQLRKWRNNQVFQRWYADLQKTHLKTKLTTLNTLKLQNFGEIFNMPNSKIFEFGRSANSTDAIGNIFDNMKRSPLWPSEKNNYEETANKFKKFVEARVIEAFTKNEKGMRSSFVSDSKWDELTISSKPLTVNFKNFNDKRIVIDNQEIISYSFPLCTHTQDNQMKTIGQLSIVALDPNFVLNPLKLMDTITNNPDLRLKIIITVQNNTTLLPQLFTIDTAGDTGEFFAKYDIRKFTDHTEFTINKK